MGLSKREVAEAKAKREAERAAVAAARAGLTNEAGNFRTRSASKEPANNMPPPQPNSNSPQRPRANSGARAQQDAANDALQTVHKMVHGSDPASSDTETQGKEGTRKEGDSDTDGTSSDAQKGTRRKDKKQRDKEKRKKDAKFLDGWDAAAAPLAATKKDKGKEKPAQTADALRALFGLRVNAPAIVPVPFTISRVLVNRIGENTAMVVFVRLGKKQTAYEIGGKTKKLINFPHGQTKLQMAKALPDMPKNVWIVASGRCSHGPKDNLTLASDLLKVMTFEFDTIVVPPQILSELFGSVNDLRATPGSFAVLSNAEVTVTHIAHSDPDEKKRPWSRAAVELPYSLQRNLGDDVLKLWGDRYTPAFGGFKPDFLWGDASEGDKLQLTSAVLFVTSQDKKPQILGNGLTPRVIKSQRVTAKVQQQQQHDGDTGSSSDDDSSSDDFDSESSSDDSDSD